jgi:hypothetical protein
VTDRGHTRAPSHGRSPFRIPASLSSQARPFLVGYPGRRGSGQRALIVGTRAVPVGLVTLKELVEEIIGDLAAC